jgi:hypothetical protein
MLWFADLEVLRRLVRGAESEFQNAIISVIRSGPRAMTTLKLWLARRQGSPEAADTTDADPDDAEPQAPQSSRSRKTKSSRTQQQQHRRSLVGPPPVPRSADVKDLAKNRDKKKCVLTKMDEPFQICHIYPYSLSKKSETVRAEFWHVLGNFWSAETIAAWKRDIFGDQSTEVCQNMLTLNTLAHDLWGMARFALEPVKISEDRKTLTMRFWWLPRYSPRVVRMRYPPPLRSDLKSGPGKSLMADCETENLIRSGHVIRMTTEDPETKPLPSFELLRMQWVLNRVAAMAGAADETDEELDEDFDGFGASVLQSLPLDLPIRPRRSAEQTSGENRPPSRGRRESSKARELAETSAEASDDAFHVVDDPESH